MKRQALIVSVLMMLMLSLAMAANIYAGQEQSSDTQSDYGIDADNIQYSKSPINKLGRGLVNTATFWAEIPAQVCKVSREQNPGIGLTLGLAEGICTGLLRGLTGIFDMVTFLIPPYDKPIMQPEYAINRADDEFKEYGW